MDSNAFLSRIIDDIVANKMVKCRNFHFGNWQEVAKSLIASGLTQAGQSSRFPCIILLPKFKEVRFATGVVVFQCEPTFYILAASGNDNMQSTERIDETFDLVLDPIYKEFIEKLRASNDIDMSKPDYREHERVDIFKAAIKDDRTALPFFIDAIELKFKKLRIFKSCKL